MATAVATKLKSKPMRKFKERASELNGTRVCNPTRSGVVKDGVVTLTGWVDSYTKRWAAEGLPIGCAGVKAVANEIEVRLPSASERTDAESPRPARALEWDAFIPLDRLGRHGCQRLGHTQGAKSNGNIKTRRGRSVRPADGVKGVTKPDHGQSPGSRRSELKQKIEQALSAQRGDRCTTNHGGSGRKQGYSKRDRAILG